MLINARIIINDKCSEKNIKNKQFIIKLKTNYFPLKKI